MDTWYYKYGVIVSLGMLGLGGYESVNWSTLTCADWAAWVQAIGSIIGLAVAIYVPWKQRKEEIRQKKRDNWEARAQRYHMLRDHLVEVVFFVGRLKADATPSPGGSVMVHLDKEELDGLDEFLITLRSTCTAYPEYALLTEGRSILKAARGKFDERFHVLLKPGDPNSDPLELGKLWKQADVLCERARETHNFAEERFMETYS